MDGPAVTFLYRIENPWYECPSVGTGSPASLFFFFCVLSSG